MRKLELVSGQPLRALRCGLLLAVALMLIASCGGKDDGPNQGGAGESPVVYTTFYPTHYFTERLASGDVSVMCPIPEDEDPIFWKPDPDTIAAYQAADLIVINGAGFEKWVLRTSLPIARIVDTAKPFEAEFLTFEQAVEHSHGPSGKHAHEGVDGHTWLDPVLAKTQAAEIARALKGLLPERAEAIDGRLAELAADLDAIDKRLKELSAGYEGEPILASHPAYNYPARRYGWKVVNLDLDPEEMPGDAAFGEIKRILEATPARFLLWESAPRPEIAERMRRELGLESVEVSPAELLGQADLAAGQDYLKVMNQNLDRLAPVLAPPR